MYVCMHVCVYMCMHECIHVHMLNMYMYMYNVGIYVCIMYVLCMYTMFAILQQQKLNKVN